MNRISRKSRGQKRRSIRRHSKASRRRSRVSKRRSKCNSRRLKQSCKRGKRCSWVKRKSSGRRRHRGYCKKGGSKLGEGWARPALGTSPNKDNTQHFSGGATVPNEMKVGRRPEKQIVINPHINGEDWKDVYKKMIGRWGGKITDDPVDPEGKIVELFAKYRPEILLMCVKKSRLFSTDDLFKWYNMDDKYKKGISEVVTELERVMKGPSKAEPGSDPRIDRWSLFKRWTPKLLENVKECEACRGDDDVGEQKSDLTFDQQVEKD